jgi:hypothetical protein
MIQLLSTCDVEGCSWSAKYEQHRVDAAIADMESHKARWHDARRVRDFVCDDAGLAVLKILSPSDYGDGVYYLMYESEPGHGVSVYSHYCSNAGFAHGDLIKYRPERRVELHAMFPGGWTVVPEPVTYSEWNLYAAAFQAGPQSAPGPEVVSG